MGLALITVVGCGGGDSSCGDFAACGGDVVGTWHAQSFCGKATISLDMCQNLVEDFNGIKIAGTETYGADKSYAADLQLSGTIGLHMPGSCLTFMGFKLTCDQVTASLMTQMGMGDGLDKVTCSTEGDGCACSGTLKPQSSKNTGTYSVSGNTLTIDDGAGNSDSNDYCVAGNTLKYKPSTSGMTVMGLNLMATAVLTK